jgi:adenylyltransferase/sulfurtransferase
VTLDADRISRYSRQLVIPAIGEAGQERLGAARVLVAGAAAAAAPGILYLVLAGVGTVWIDDPEAVGPGDAGGWLYPPGAIGSPRALAAAESLQERSRFVQVLPVVPDARPTAMMVFAGTPTQAVGAAERARKAGLPVVVAEPDGEGGSVVTVPVGAPCYSCGRSIGSAWRPASPGSAAVGILAAEELILLLADPSSGAGRRVDLVRGVPSTRATTRLVGCACGAGIAR